MSRSPLSSNSSGTNNTNTRSFINPHQLSLMTASPANEESYEIKAQPSNQKTDENSMLPYHITDSLTSINDQQAQVSDGTISAIQLHSQGTQSSNGYTPPIYQQHKQQPSRGWSSTNTSALTPENNYDRNCGTGSICQHSHQHGDKKLVAPQWYINIARQKDPDTLTSSTRFGPRYSIRHDEPLLSTQDRQRLLQQRQQPTLLARRRSLTDIPNRPNSTSSTQPSPWPHLSSSVQQESQGCLRKSSHSAGFMRPSKCAACNPDPPAKPSILTPPRGVGVPLIGPPPDVIRGPLPKNTLRQHTSSPSRDTWLYSRRTSHDLLSDLNPSPSIDTTGNRRQSNRTHKNRTGHVNRCQRLSHHGNRMTTKEHRDDNSFLYDRRNIFGKQGDNDNITNYSSSSGLNGTPNYDKSSLLDEHKHDDTFDRSRLFGKNSNNCSTTTCDSPSIYGNHSYHSPSRRTTLDQTGQVASESRSTQTRVLEQQVPSVLDMDEDSLQSPPSSATTTTTVASLSNHYAPLATSVPFIETMTCDLRKLLSKLLRSEYAALLDDSQGPLEKDAADSNQHSLPATMKEIIQQSGLVHDHLLGLEQQLQALLNTPKSTCTNNEFRQVTSGLSSETLVVDEASNSTMGKACASLSVSNCDSDVTSTDNRRLNHDREQWQQKPPPLELWTAKLCLTLNKWFSDLNHGYLKNYEVSSDGSITTMAFTGHVATTEPSVISQLIGIHKTESLSLTLEQPIHHQYTMTLSPVERWQNFALKLSDLWISDEQVDYCQFKNMSTQCQYKFNWVNRRHHCRRCGNIFCSTHSSNRLPLFTEEKPNQIKWSRVCDSCCYHMVGPYLMSA